MSAFGSSTDICNCTSPCRLLIAHFAMSALPPKADMCGALAHVRFGPIADIGPTSDERGDARQDNLNLRELARLRIDFDSACVLFHDDVVADGETKAGAFSGRFG